MSRNFEHMDEYILAAYLTGDLTDTLRQEITAYIARNENATDILAMASDALAAAESGDGAPFTGKEDCPWLSVCILAANSSLPAAQKKPWKVYAFIASVVLILALIVALLVVDSFSTQGTAASWSPSISSSIVELTWPSQAGAVDYHVVLLNQDTGKSTILFRTSGNVFSTTDESNPFEPMNSYLISVLALGDDGIVVSQSSSIPVRLSNQGAITKR